MDNGFIIFARNEQDRETIRKAIVANSGIIEEKSEAADADGNTRVIMKVFYNVIRPAKGTLLSRLASLCTKISDTFATQKTQPPPQIISPVLLFSATKKKGAFFIFSQEESALLEVGMTMEEFLGSNRCLGSAMPQVKAVLGKIPGVSKRFTITESSCKFEAKDSGYFGVPINSKNYEIFGRIVCSVAGYGSSN